MDIVITNIPLSESIEKSLPSITNSKTYKWTFNNGQVLFIDGKDPNYCNNCYYIVGISAYSFVKMMFIAEIKTEFSAILL